MPGLKRSLGAALLIVALGVLAGCAAVTSFTASSQYGGQSVRLRGELYRPVGPGPFPAVVLLHGCSGIKENYRQWARLLSEWGYVAYVLDSLGPRGLGSVCNKRALSARARSVDAYDAKAYLAGLPYVRADSIGLMGWSHGGIAALWAADPATLRTGDSFQAYIALYPGCWLHMTGLRAPLLILAGARDDWTPAAHCQALAQALATRAGPPVTIKVYPQATHAWDRDRPPRYYQGHRLEYDPVATSDSQKMVREFLGRYLRGR
ncbi:MAG: dienelactone hydrolase family protein [Proteobacteria bacterium]|nr:dienelactone hydrolase family protein [Pseudomonadota bacterium]MBU2468483.1 dienelactone hydrolase family protein [Pseudomonadota bacterium]